MKFYLCKAMVRPPAWWAAEKQEGWVRADSEESAKIEFRRFVEGEVEGEVEILRHRTY